MTEDEVYAAIEDALCADYEARDAGSLTPDERRDVANWQQARAERV